MVTKISQSQMDEVKAQEYAVIDFSAVWCGPCKMLAPVLEEISEELGDVAFYNIDVDENMDLAQQFRITNIPALAFLKKGELTDMSVGFQPKEELVDWIESQK